MSPRGEEVAAEGRTALPDPPPAPNLAILPLLAAAAFCASAGIRLLDPVLPMLARDFGIAVADAAILVTAFALPYAFCQVLLGPLGDRFGKVRVLTIGTTLFGLATLACALSASIGQLIALRAATGALGGAIIPLAMAWIGDNVPYAERQATISKFMTGVVLAQLMIGPISGAAGQVFGWRAIFVLVGLVALGAGIAILARLGRRLWQPRVAGSGSLGYGSYALLLRHSTTRLLLLAVFLDGVLLLGGAFPFVGSYMVQGFHLEAWQAGLVVAGFGAGALFYTRIAGRLVKRLGEVRLLTLGGMLLAIGLLVLAHAPSWPAAAVAQTLLGLFFFMFHGVLQARSTEVLPQARATAVSSFSLVLFLGQGIGSIGFGALLRHSDYSTGFTIAALGMVALTLWTRTVLRRPG